MITTRFVMPLSALRCGTPAKSRFLRWNSRQNILCGGLLFVFIGSYFTFADHRGLWAGFKMGVPFLIFGLGQLAFLYYHMTRRLFFCEKSMYFGNLLADRVLFVSEVPYEEIYKLEYSVVTRFKNRIQIWIKGDSYPKTLDCDDIEEESPVWRQFQTYLKPGVFHLSAQQRLEEIEKSRIHGREPFSWKAYLTKRPRRYGE